MGWWMIFGGSWMLLFWGFIIWLIVWGIQKITGRRESDTRTSPQRDPLDIAKERYARGGISKDEFDQIKKDLSLPEK